LYTGVVGEDDCFTNRTAKIIIVFRIANVLGYYFQVIFAHSTLALPQKGKGGHSKYDQPPDSAISK